MIGLKQPLRSPVRFAAAATATLVFVVMPLGAQNAAQTATSQNWNPQQILRTETYVHPPADVERIIMAPRTDISFTAPSPDRKWFLRAPGEDRGDIEEYGKSHIYLGGVQVDTKANRARSLTTSTHHGLTLVDPRTNATKTIETPKGASISAQSWSPTGAQIAYIANFDDASHVFVADVSTGKSVQVTKTPILGTLVTSLDWTADGKSIVTVLVPEGRGAAPTHGKNGVEDGPQVRLTESRAIPQVIHPSLLEDPHDKAMLKYYSTGQLALIDVKSKAVKKIGGPGMIRAVDASPDGQYFRVTLMTEPFSYIVPVSNFGSIQQLWDISGRVVATLNTTPLREGERTGDDVPAAGGRGGAQQTASDTGKRNIQWNPAGPGLVYMQSVFGPAGSDNNAAAPSGAGGGGRGGRGGGAGRAGQAGRPQPTSVRYMSWLPPYGAGDTKLVHEGTARLTGVAYSGDGKTMFVSDSGAVFAIRTADPSKKFNLGRGVTLPAGGGGFGGGGGRGGAGGAGNDTTGGGGALAMKLGANGAPVVVVGSDNKTVYVSGTRAPGANWQTQAPRPWVDKLDFESGQRARIFDSPADAYDEFVAPLDDDYAQYIYTHESPTVITDAYLRDTKAGTSKKLTNARDVAPEITGAQYKRLQITRPRDGVKFWVDVTLPKDWRPGTRLPGIIWFYPREFTSQADYDRSKYGTNINKFPEVPSARPASSTKIWVTQGYALLEPDSPIMGDSGKMNDHYTRDLKENLDAVIDAAVDAGYVDRNKMGLGGHSYGAFSTVNGLTLTPYFKAGIAGDGMYNRSLTPFGFQSERRDFFQAQDTYLDMSPFYRADKISGALLMYHALEDQNVGTAPISSVRMYHALQGLGKPAALYMYPYEDHSDATYASDLDLWARWFAWFDVYVKNPPPKGVTP
ncbi:MAG: prolyl oligopeptidase family serine peptidase [bacterium]